MNTKFHRLFHLYRKNALINPKKIFIVLHLFSGSARLYPDQNKSNWILEIGAELDPQHKGRSFNSFNQVEHADQTNVG